jgi:predicted ABC-type ATPase
MSGCSIFVSEEDKENYFKERIRNKKKGNVAIITIGGPGSGKTTTKNDTIVQLGLNIDDFVDMDPDIIFSSFFKNRQECFDNIKPINDILFKKAYQQHFNVIVDGTGKNFDKKYERVIKVLKAHGYTIYLCIIHNDIDVALERIRLRALRTGRNVPTENVKSIYETLGPHIIDYLNIPCEHVDGIFLYDNSDTRRLELITQCTPSGEKYIHHVDSIFLFYSLMLFLFFLFFLFFILFPSVYHLRHIFQGKSFKAFFRS